MVKRNLRVYERDRIFPQSIAPYLELLACDPTKNYYLANYWDVMVYKDNYFWWARDVDLLESAFRKWCQRWLSSKSARESIYRAHRQDVVAIRRMKRLKKVDWHKLDGKKLSKIYLEAISAALSHLKHGEYTNDLFDDFFGKIFKEYLHSVCPTMDESDANTLCEPATLSTMASYRLKILRMSIKNDSAAIDKNFVDQFGWVRMAWDGAGEMSSADMRAEVKDLRKIGAVKRKNEITGLENFSARVRKQRRSILNKYQLKDKKIAVYFELLDRFNIMHDYRKEVQMRTNQIIYRVLREIPLRFPAKYEDLMYYLNQEVEILLKIGRTPAARLIVQRKQGWAWFIRAGKIKKYLGATAGAVLKKLIIEPTKFKSEVKEIKGVVACTGLATGVAVVAKGAEEANRKIKEGQILVTTMTTPDYLPAMRKAAAIVTDDGGITCHAAVISRELGIPCIVGTKFATKMIKDGDKIFIDNGLVKIF